MIAAPAIASRLLASRLLVSRLLAPSVALWSILFVAFVLVACDGAGTASPLDAQDDPTETPPTEPEPPESVAFEGFTLSPEEGAYWEYTWTTTSWAGPSGGSSRSGYMCIVLGSPVSTNGLTAFPLEVSGGPDFSWTHFAFEPNRIQGSKNGTDFQTLFEGRKGKWAGGGLFRSFKDDVLIEGIPATNDFDGRYYIGSDWVDAGAIRVGQSMSSSQCEMINGIRICGSDESETARHYEWWAPAIGPVGGTVKSAVGFYGSETEILLADYALAPAETDVPAPEMTTSVREVQLQTGPGLQFFTMTDRAATYHRVTVTPPSPYEAFTVDLGDAPVDAGVQIGLQEPNIGYQRVEGTWSFEIEMTATVQCVEQGVTATTSVEIAPLAAARAKTAGAKAGEGARAQESTIGGRSLAAPIQ